MMDVIAFFINVIAFCFLFNLQLFSGGQEFLVDGSCKRRACGLTRAAKRVCCGSSDGEREAGPRARPSGGSCVPSPPGEARASRNGTARGRVRLYRVRSFLSDTLGHQNGVTGAGGPAPDLRETLEGRVPGEAPWVNGDHTTERDGARVEDAKGEAARRQTELEERTDRLWRRLQAVQAKQVERHVAQQLVGLQSRTPGRWSSVELSRLARNCEDILRTAEGALDSDHTASSSGGGSDSEEENAEGRRHVLPAPVKSV